MGCLITLWLPGNLAETTWFWHLIESNTLRQLSQPSLAHVGGLRLSGQVFPHGSNFISINTLSSSLGPALAQLSLRMAGGPQGKMCAHLGPVASPSLLPALQVSRIPGKCPSPGTLVVLGGCRSQKVAVFGHLGLSTWGFRSVWAGPVAEKWQCPPAPNPLGHLHNVGRSETCGLNLV